MSDDILSRATRALRDESRDDDASARFTRSRIMASVHEQRVKRRTRLVFLMPIAATFVAASAWGAANGKLGRAFHVVSHALGIEPRESAAPPPPKAAPRSRVPDAPIPALAPPPDVPAEVPTLAPPPDAQPAPSIVASAPERPVAAVALSGVRDADAASRAGAGSRDPTLELYRTAHQAHFVDRDSGRALGAWDAYLKAAPNGPLALEARYNRALCLVRLHRVSDARAALTPFAAGRYAGYRKKEASELLDALPPELAGPTL